MIRYSVLFLLLLHTITGISQSSENYGVLILTCDNWQVENNIPFDKGAKVNDFDYEEYKERILNGFEFKVHKPNVKKTILSEMDYLESYTLQKIPSYGLYNFLVPMLKKDDNLVLTLARPELTSQNINYKSLAESYKTQYVLSISSVKIYSGKEGNELEMLIQLYNVINDSIVFEAVGKGKTYFNEESYNQCAGSLDCLVSQAVDQIGFGLRKAIHDNTIHSIQEREVNIKRELVWKTILSDKNLDTALYNSVMKVSEKNVVDLIPFEVIVSDDQTMFKALFLEEVQNNSEQELIYNDKCNCPEGKKYEIQEISAFMFGNTWYFSDIQTFDCSANSRELAKIGYLKVLIKDDFFKENSIERSEDFWKKNHFERVISEVERQQESIRIKLILMDLAQDSTERKEYENQIKEYYQIDDENKSFIGMFRLVANEKMKERELNDKEFNSKLLKHVVSPFLSQMEMSDPETKYNYVGGLNTEMTIIFPPDSSLFLLPVHTVKNNGKESLMMYVFKKDQQTQNYLFYTCSYFKKTLLQEDSYYDELLKMMNSHTSWEYSYRYLNDIEFWSELTAKNENNQFVHLSKIELK